MLSLGRFRISFLLGFFAFLVVLPGCKKQSSSTNQDPSDQADNCLYSLPFHTQGIYKVTQGSLSEFEGWSHSPGRLEQYAIDFGLPGGTDVLASREGVVSSIRDDNTACGGQDMANYSNYVIVNHGDGTYALYNHLQAGIVVDEDEHVKQGQLLGYSGNTGYSNCGPQMNKGYHLHFQLQESGDGFDTSIPIPCFKGVAGGIPNRGMILSAQDEIPFITGYVSEQATILPDDASSILGVWEGSVSSIGEGWSETTTKRFEIKNDCNSEGICLTVPWLENNGKTFDQIENLEETELEAPLYCFGEYQEIVQMSLIYWFCFHPIDQSTLQYEGGGGLWYEEGVLNRLSSESSNTPKESEITFLATLSEGYAINKIDLVSNETSTIVASPSRISGFAWSYDGVKIAYAVESLTGDSMSVNMLDVTTHTVETIIWPQKISAGQFERYLTYTQPRWSPNGDFLYFRADDGRASGSSLRRISLSSGRQIVISPPSASFDFDVSAINGFVVWREWFNGYDGHGIFLADSDGDVYKTILDPVSGSELFCVSWSPDERFLAISAPEKLQCCGKNKYIWIIDSNGNDLRQVTEDTDYIDMDPVFSPDGKWLAFTRKDVTNQNSDIWIVSINGDVLINLTDTPEVDESLPEWKPY